MSTINNKFDTKYLSTTHSFHLVDNGGFRTRRSLIVQNNLKASFALKGARFFSSNQITSDPKNHKTKKTIYNFRGLKLKLIPWGSRYLKVVNSQGTYQKASDDVLVDFCGKEDVKKHLNNIYQSIMTGI